MSSFVQVLPYKQETKGQYVITNSKRMKFFNLGNFNYGVSQVSVLVPLLFVMYINDLTHGIHHEAKSVISADDRYTVNCLEHSRVTNEN